MHNCLRLNRTLMSSRRISLGFIDPAHPYGRLIVRPRGEGRGEYSFVDGKIRGLVRIVMIARHSPSVAATAAQWKPRAGNPRDGERPGPARSHGLAGDYIQVLSPQFFIEQITMSRSRKSPSEGSTVGWPTFTGKGRGGSGGVESCRCWI